MALAVKKNESSSLNQDSKKSTSRDRVRATHTQEIVFVLCGYMGSNIRTVAESLQSVMENDYGYECQRIKLSKFIEINRPKNSYNAQGSNDYIRIKNLIEDGNSMRDKYGSEILVELAIEKIGLDRLDSAEKTTGEENVEHLQFKSQRKCYIIESVKNLSELSVLKEVYRNLLYTIGVFSPYKIRHDNLRHKDVTEKEIAELIDQDSHEEIPHGQDVRDTFTKADYFLRYDSASKSFLQARLRRFVHLIFGSEIITPTIDETAMYIASSAASNSACLSRQVGACITDKNGCIVSIGWNDVPNFKGNLYYHQSSSDIQGKNDNRCLNFHNGVCMNDEYKIKISNRLIDEIIKSGLIKEENKVKLKNIINKSRLKSLIEFSRSIHAEMHAIIIGSQKTGDKMIGGKLYCTTYPCHNCARHIVLSGITEVYYIEPYSKSLAIDLHSDSLTEDENDTNRVKLLLYDGVSPSRYTQMFKMGDLKRKDLEGKVVKMNLKKALPRFTEPLEALYTLESTATKNLKGLDLNVNINLISLSNENKKGVR